MNPLEKLIDRCTDLLLDRQEKVLHQTVFDCVEDTRRELPDEQQLVLFRFAVYMAVECRLEKRCEYGDDNADLDEYFISRDHAEFAKMGGQRSNRLYEQYVQRKERADGALAAPAAPAGQGCDETRLG